LLKIGKIKYKLFFYEKLSLIVCHGHASSNARYDFNTVSLSKRLPTSCIPMGKSVLNQPQGMEAAGCTVKLNGKEKACQPVGETFFLFIFGENIIPKSNAVTAVVGVIRRSNSLKMV
jgi:hypothetical protein